jgi:hypothetical protein
MYTYIYIYTFILDTYSCLCICVQQKNVRETYAKRQMHIKHEEVHVRF